MVSNGGFQFGFNDDGRIISCRTNICENILITPHCASTPGVLLILGRLTWLVYIIGAVIGGRGSTYTTFEEYDALDGELVCRCGILYSLKSSIFIVLSLVLILSCNM